MGVDSIYWRDALTRLPCWQEVHLVENQARGLAHQRKSLSCSTWQYQQYNEEYKLSVSEYTYCCIPAPGIRGGVDDCSI